MAMWNLQIKIIYILGHTDNDKDRLQHPEQQIWLAFTQQEQIDSIMEKIPKMSGILRDNCCETCLKTDAFLERLQQLLINKRNI